MSGSDGLKCTDLEVWRTSLLVLEQVSFAIEPGQLVVLSGPNGAGKTSLLETFAGLLPLKSGTVELHGVRLNRLPPHRRAALGLRLVRDPGLFNALSERGGAGAAVKDVFLLSEGNPV
jgi:ABC-type branched-subunit amino acid transport system ATPase component